MTSITDIDVEDHGAAPMPLRVIDVETTIMNRGRGGIYFTRRQTWHVISHTWSADVRDFSKIVGEQLKAAAQDQLADRRSYEQLFEAANFSHSPSYQRFVDFLMILREDKVRWVWFDAVCINQTDLQEKDKEIQQMGTYYERSLGSYVVHHGIGKGFTLLEQSDHEGMELPRWFSRAWTFQEWVLPQSTTFIIDLASEENLHKTASIAILRGGRNCFCCDYESTFHPQYLQECMRHSVHGDEDDLSTSFKGVRSLCRYNMGRLHPHFRRIPDRKDWYFTDDLGYVFLVKMKLQMKNAVLWRGSGFIVQQSHALSDSEFQLTERLGVKMWFHGMSDHRITTATKMPLVIDEISVRDCSNAEDRVLSVLKLLGVEGAIQVRSQKTLNQQILHLARSLLEKGEDQYSHMLLRLCLADGYGNETPGMSWAPHFEVKKGSWQEAGRQLAQRMVKGTYMQTFEATAQVQEVSMAGELRLMSKAVFAGQLICCKHKLQVAKNRSRSDELVKTMSLQLGRGGEVVLHFCARFSPQLAADACVLEHLSDNSLLQHGNSCIVVRTPGISQPVEYDHPPFPFRVAWIHSPLDHLRERIPVWLLNMGVGTHGSSSPDKGFVTYFLVCVGDNLQSPLHKIGYMGISSSLISKNQIAGVLENEQTMCCIGGLGRNSTKHIFEVGASSCSNCVSPLTAENS